METAVSEYVSLGFGITRYKFMFETQVAHQLPYRGRKAGALRSSLEQKAISPDGTNQAASVSRADHDDLFCVSHGEQNLSNV